MQLAWKVTAVDAARIREFVRSRRSDPFARNRIARNVRGDRPALSVRRFWRGLLLGLLTTQQRSGPSSAVARFLVTRPFPLSYRRCCAARDPAALSLRALKAHGGIRRTQTIAGHVAQNLVVLRGGGWRNLLPALRVLESPHRRTMERLAAEVLAESFVGLGPKQSRNVLQFLGLTRFEIPIDSRLVAWLNEFGFPIHLSASALTDPNYYAFVSSGVQAVCRKAGVYLCVLNAAVFTSFDADA